MADDPSSLCTSSHLSEGKINKKKNPARAETPHASVPMCVTKWSTWESAKPA